MRDSVVTLRALVDEGVEKEIDIVGRLRVTFAGGLNQRRRVPHVSLVGDGVRGLFVFLNRKNARNWPAVGARQVLESRPTIAFEVTNSGSLTAVVGVGALVPGVSGKHCGDGDQLPALCR